MADEIDDAEDGDDGKVKSLGREYGGYAEVVVVVVALVLGTLGGGGIEVWVRDSGATECDLVGYLDT